MMFRSSSLIITKHTFPPCQQVLRLHTPKSFDDLKNTIETALDKTKGTIFGLMADNMSKKDVQKFISHWEKRIHPDIPPQHQTQNETKRSNPTAVKTDKVENETNKTPVTTQTSDIDKNMKEIAFAKKKDLLLYHPILGELVVDLGYKKIYMTSVNSLAKTPVWERQRILRPERANLIAEDKIRKGMSQSLPGMITLYMNEESNDIGIIDGQHRAGALMILAQKGHWNEYMKNVAIEVFPVNNEAEIVSLFREINAAEPVRLIDLPEEAGSQNEEEIEQSQGTSLEKSELSTKELSSKGLVQAGKKQLENKERAIVTEAVEILKNRYPDMFKPTSRCKIPHLNADVLRDDIFSNGIISTRGITSTEELLTYLESVNNSLSDKYAAIMASPKKRKLLSKSVQNAISKSVSLGFFLGIEKDWLISTSSSTDESN